MSLAPPWAKAAAVTGLHISRLQCQTIIEMLPDTPVREMYSKRLLELEAEIDRIEAMKN